jgi:uncharacterized protein (DUF2384 family)
MEKEYELPYAALDGIPDRLSESEVLYALRSKNIDTRYLNAMSAVTSYSLETMAGWLNVTPRTLRNYQQKKTTWNEAFKEHLLLLLGLFKHGLMLFGTSAAFDEWLKLKNFHFDDASPVTFLNTVTGIRFIDNFLTAMEFGDNV